MTGHIDLRSCVIMNMYVEVVSHLKLEKFVSWQLHHIINLQEYVLLLFLHHAPVTGEEQRLLHQLSKDLEKFRSEIIVSPSNSCFSCHHLTYPQGGSYVTYETVEDLIAPLYSHPTTIPLPDVPEGECVWLCTRCQSILGKGKVPPHACINIQVVKVPPVLSVLNTMEQRLISKVQAFMKLIVLPLGQRALAGQSINFPVDVSQVCNALPRPIDESGVVLVQSSSSTSASTSTADGGKVHHLLYHHHLLLPLIPAKGMWLESRELYIG